jgi:hypothetical protein
MHLSLKAMGDYRDFSYKLLYCIWNSITLVQTNKQIIWPWNKFGKKRQCVTAPSVTLRERNLTKNLKKKCAVDTWRCIQRLFKNLIRNTKCLHINLSYSYVFCVFSCF